jgi:hypothetical protein
MPDGIRRFNDVIAEDDFVFFVNSHEYFVHLVEPILLSSIISSELQFNNTT